MVLHVWGKAQVGGARLGPVAGGEHLDVEVNGLGQGGGGDSGYRKEIYRKEFKKGAPCSLPAHSPSIA